MIKKFISILLIIIIACGMAVQSIAASISELKDQKAEVEGKKEEITAEKNTILDEISELNIKISDYKNDIEELNLKIKDLENEITDKETEIKELDKENRERENLLVNRLVAMYEKGQITYLEVLLSSEDITTFISNYYRVEEITKADQEVIESILAKQEKTQVAKEELEKDKEEVNESKKEVEAKNKKLQVAKKAKQAKVNSLSDEERELQETIDKFEVAIKDAQKEIQEATSSANSSGGGYTGKFEGILSWPISSSTPYYNYISSYFGPRQSPTAGASSNHGAVDIPISFAPIYAPAEGKVLIARRLSGYGNYIMIDHGNGYYTGFGHLSSYNVSEGQSVSRGQLIGTSGDTGIVTGPHLHYEVYIGGTANSYRVDPLLYTSHPSLI